MISNRLVTEPFDSPSPDGAQQIEHNLLFAIYCKYRTNYVKPSYFLKKMFR